MLPDPSRLASNSSLSSRFSSIDIAEEFCLEDELSLLVFFRGFIGLVVLPSHRLLALLAAYVSHYVSSSRHVTISCLAGDDVDYAVEEESFAMLAAEVLESSISLIRPNLVVDVLTRLMISS